MSPLMKRLGAPYLLPAVNQNELQYASPDPPTCPSSLPITMLGARTSGGTRSGRPPGNRSSSTGRVRPPGAVLDQPSFARMILSDVLTVLSLPCV